MAAHWLDTDNRTVGRTIAVIIAVAAVAAALFFESGNGVPVKAE